ncbi:MAG: hypothetical protein Fur0025_45570 [Oscillatoriaceae cyanobacterium]
MSGVTKIQVTEEPETLKELMRSQKNSLSFAKVQALYLLRIQAADTIEYLAVLVGRSEMTVHRWLRLYREGGLSALLEEKKPPGRPPKIKVEIVAKIQQELRDPEGFSSYKEIQLWLALLGTVIASYSSVYRCVRQELNAKLKVPRPRSDRQPKDAEKNFRLELPDRLCSIVSRVKNLARKSAKIRYWCSDETRLGLHTLVARKITLKGVKPLGIHRWGFSCFYLYGLGEPRTGDSFFYEFSHLDTIGFEKFLKLFSQKYPDDYHIIQVDNAPSHTSECLEIPENIILLFQPPYSPEVNPIERLWQYLKGFLKWLVHEQLEPLRVKVGEILNQLSAEIIRSLTGWDFILNALSLSGL